jgi:hypothetical protein
MPMACQTPWGAVTAGYDERGGRVADGAGDGKELGAAVGAAATRSFASRRSAAGGGAPTSNLSLLGLRGRAR